MILRSTIVTIFLSLALQSYPQVDFSIRQQKIHPLFIDTTKENIFIYEVPAAILYFRQADIRNFIDNPANKTVLANYGYKAFQDTINANTREISVRDIYFSYDQQQRDSIFKQEPEDARQRQLNEEFYFIGAAILLKGRFMIYSKANRKFITKGLVAKQQKEHLGQRDLVFYLPGRKRFYSIVTSLGE